PRRHRGQRPRHRGRRGVRARSAPARAADRAVVRAAPPAAAGLGVRASPHAARARRARAAPRRGHAGPAGAAPRRGAGRRGRRRARDARPRPRAHRRDVRARHRRGRGARGRPRAGGIGDRGAVSTLEVDESAWPSGRELRRLTKLATEAHGGGSFGDLLEEVYTVVFSVAVAVAVAFGATATLNTKLRPSTAATTLDPAWLALAAGVVALGVGIGLAGRLGPLGVGGGQAAWWLPTPADRRGLLRPRLLLLVVVSVAVGAGLGALVATLGGGSAAAPAAAAGAALGPVAVLAVARTQVAGLGRSVHPAVVVGESLTVAAPLLALLVVLLDPGAPPAVPVAALVAGGVVLALVAVLLLVDTDRRLDAISGAELRARGAVTAYAAGAVTSLDTRELGRALTITAQRDARSRSVDLAWVRGPVSALVTGDAVLTLRSRRHVI